MKVRLCSRSLHSLRSVGMNARPVGMTVGGRWFDCAHHDRTAALGRDDRDNRSEDKKVLPEVRDDVVAGEGGKAGGKFRRSGFPGQGEIADDETQ